MLLKKKIKPNYLIIIGGAEDKRDRKIILKEIVELTKAQSIIVIPTASYYPEDVRSNYFDAFKSLGVTNIETLDIRYKDEVDREDHLAKIETADVIFYGGGDQVKLVNTLEGTKFLERVHARYEEGTLTIAGTSAGAAAASDGMIYDGDYEGFFKNSVNHSKGFKLLEEVTVDTHFNERGRLARLAQFLASGNGSKGIGIDEDTCLIIYSDMNARVLGSGMVTVLRADRNTQTDYTTLASNERYSIHNLRLSYFASGTTFNIKKWSFYPQKEEELRNNNFIEKAILH